jgi:hypothetical protein
MLAIYFCLKSHLIPDVKNSSKR